MARRQPVLLSASFHLDGRVSTNHNQYRFRSCFFSNSNKSPTFFGLYKSPYIGLYKVNYDFFQYYRSSSWSRYLHQTSMYWSKHDNVAMTFGIYSKYFKKYFVLHCSYFNLQEYVFNTCLNMLEDQLLSYHVHTAQKNITEAFIDAVMAGCEDTPRKAS